MSHSRATHNTPLVPRPRPRRPPPPRWSNTFGERAHADFETVWAPRRALVAEDNDDMRSMLALWLRREGFEVMEALDGEELDILLAAFGRVSPDEIAIDLVVSDVRMPGLNGLEVLSRLRAVDAMTPVIMISAFADRDVVAEAKRLGANFLHKPIRRSELRATLAALGLGENLPHSAEGSTESADDDAAEDWLS